MIALTSYLKRKEVFSALINEDSLLELDLAVPSIKKESLPPNVEGGAPFLDLINYHVKKGFYMPISTSILWYIYSKIHQTSKIAKSLS